ISRLLNLSHLERNGRVRQERRHGLRRYGRRLHRATLPTRVTRRTQDRIGLRSLRHMLIGACNAVVGFIKASSRGTTPSKVSSTTTSPLQATKRKDFP